MNNRMRYIPVSIGAILLSLLAIVPAFGADEVGFIDPNDINPDGTLSDSTPDDQEWARQGGRIGLMLSDDGLDTPVKRVLIPSIDARMVGRGDVNAHSDTITNASVSGLSGDDYILIGMNTIRQVDSVTTTDGDTSITVDKAFRTGMSNVAIYRINDSVTNLSPWDDGYSSYAMAETIGAGQASYRESSRASRYNAQHAIADSDVGKGGTTPLDRISGTPTGTVNTTDVMVLKVSASNSVTRIDVDDVSGDRLEMEDVPGATASNPLGLAGNETAYLVYWAEERNETGSVVTVRSQAHQDPVTAVLTETTPTSGEFVLEIQTVAPQDADGNDVAPDFSASVPTLPVNPRDVVTLAGADSTATITVETSSPVFSGFAPAHNTAGWDDRPEVTAQVTNGDSGLDDDGDNIYVIFRITEGGSIKTVTLEPKADGEVVEVSGGFVIRQRLPARDAPEDDATIEWWVKAMDEAGNVGYSDRQASGDGVEDPCTADDDTAVSGLVEAGCQPFVIFVDSSSPDLPRPDTDREVLVALYNATNGPNWKTRTNWLSDRPIGEWYGVDTDNLENVTLLSLADNRLAGTIPPQLGNLSYLEDLWLWENRLTGEIPTSLGNLSNLRTLAARDNQLTGEIPASLGNLSYLKSLTLYDNQLTGTIPPQLGSLSNLEHLRLSGNQLTGEIPASLGNLSNLEDLWLSDNQLTGEIPTSLGNLSYLEHLLLSNNQLTGEIPTSLGNLTSLRWLRLGGNQLTGCIPDGLRGVKNNDLDRTGLPFCEAQSHGVPTVSMSTAGIPLVRINAPIPVTATFSEPVIGFTVDDVSVVNGTASNLVGSDDSRVYSFDVTPTAIGDVKVDIPAGVVEDANANGNLAAEQLSLGIPYDDDHDGSIGGSEILAAVRDYFGGRLTGQQILALVRLYFESSG